MKRHLPGDKDENLSVKRQRCYEGYKIDPSITQQLDVVRDLSAKDFFHKYICQRKPCVIEGLSFSDVTLETLKTVAGKEHVQVEKRFDSKEQFGQARTSSRQVNFTLEEFLQELQGPNKELYYLSTQESSSDRETSLFQTPCQQLLRQGKIPSTLPLAGNLVLQACNLWMGAASDACSGLHHDFHDNFYILVQGSKKFDLYPPDADIQTYGTIHQIHPNGLISYQNNPTRSDGVTIHGVLLGEEEDDDDDDDGDGLPEDYGEVEGFGFRDMPSDEEDFDEDAADDYDLLVSNGNENESSESEAIDQKGRPNQFAITGEPSSSLICLSQTITAGQCLYLPASWFHCVTSSPCKESPVHMAFNYWYHPPNSNEFNSPYQDKFWVDRQAAENVKVGNASNEEPTVFKQGTKGSSNSAWS